MPKGALLIVLNNKNEVLLQHKDAGAPTHANKWCLFGGGVEPGETTEVAIRREFKEELEWSLTKITHLKEYHDNDAFLVNTTKTADELRPKLHEGSDLRFFSLEELPNVDVALPHRRIIEDYFATKPTQVLFICRGNAFRSIIAETYLRSLSLPNLTVISRGTVAKENKRANDQRFAQILALLERHNLLPFAKKKHAEQLTQQDIDSSDLVICVNDRVFDNCSVKFVLPPSAMIWDIADIGDPGLVVHDKEELLRVEENTFAKIERHVDQLRLALT